MVTNSVDMVLSKGIGSASFGVLKGSGKAGLLLEIIFMLETSRKENINIDRFLPNTPLRIVIDHTCEDVCDLYSAEMLNKNLIPGQIDPFLDNEIFRDTVLPNMISAAKDIAEEQAAGIITNGLQKMNNTLNHEIERLQVLQTKNKNVRPQEIHIAQKEQETLASIIKNARIRMDAVLLISMG
jgi:ATP-dependent helicase HepA